MVDENHTDFSLLITQANKHLQSFLLFLVKNIKKLSSKGDKMKQNWASPREVVEYVGSNTYHLRRRDGNRMFFVQQWNIEGIQ